MSACPRCQAPLETPLACRACGVLFSVEPAPTPFAIFGIDESYAVDAAALQKRLLELSRLMHPDYFGARGDEQRALAERNTAELNSAYEILSDDTARADWLVRHFGGPSELEERTMPQAFLAEVLEWNEALEAARDAAAGSPERVALDSLGKDLRAQRATTLATLRQILTPLPARGSKALVDARRALNALRYLDKTLAEIEALRLAQAATR